MHVDGVYLKVQQLGDLFYTHYPIPTAVTCTKCYRRWWIENFPKELCRELNKVKEGIA